MTSKPHSKKSHQLGLFKSDERPNAYKKAVEVVHSKPAVQLTLLQAKLGNCLLKNAHETQVDDDGFFVISTTQMAKTIGFDSNNTSYLKESARTIMDIKFSYDVFSLTYKEETEYAALFPVIRVNKHSTTLRYKINETLRDKVMTPEVYALIDMNVLNRFQRAQSIPLYEHCVRYINVGQTNTVKWETLRDVIMSSRSGTGVYSQYKYFKSKILGPCITEINTFSDMEITEIVEGREGRFVSFIQFKLRRKAPEAQTPENTEKQAEVSKELEGFGVSPAAIRKYLKTHKTIELLSAIEYTKQRQSDKRATKLEKPAAYFKQALENGWGIVDAESPGNTPSVQPKDHASEARTQIESDFQEHQVNEARRRYETMDESEKEIDIARYNQQQTLPYLQISKSKKPSAAGQTAFFRWFAIDKWGVPTETDLLTYATAMLSKAKRRK